VTKGAVVAIDSRGSLIRSEGGALIAAIGLDKMAVIAVRDAVLVAPLARVAEVKAVVERITGQAPDRVARPADVVGPWGSSMIAEGSGYRVSRIVVDSGQGLPRRDRADGSAYWIVVSGSAEVTLEGEHSILGETGSILIPAGATVELANPAEAPLQIVEIEFGGLPTTN